MLCSATLLSKCTSSARRLLREHSRLSEVRVQLAGECVAVRDCACVLLIELHLVGLTALPPCTLQLGVGRALAALAADKPTLGLF